MNMDLTICSVLFWLVVFFVTAVVTMTASARTNFNPMSTQLLPPEVKGIALLRLLATLCTKGPEATTHYLYNKFGSVFSVSFLWKRTTFLVGQEASATFFQGLESEVSHGDVYEFSVPLFGEEFGYAVDYATRMEQKRFFVESLQPAKLRNHVDPMLREVEDYFAKWAEEGVVDLKAELEKLLTLISSRILAGKEVREKILGQFSTLLHEIEQGLNLISFMFPYIPTPANRRRDRARVKLIGILSEIVRSRRRFNRVEDDVLQRMIDSKYQCGRATTEGEVSGLVIALIIGGKHTSVHTSTWTGALLLSHPQFLDAALDEQKQMVGKHGSKMDYSILSEMGTLHSCIKEAARMHPALPTGLRKAQKDITVSAREGKEYVIPKGNTLVNLFLMNGMLPHIYKDPEVYDPDRFRPGREEDKIAGRFSYTSFGGGRHACTGEAYAYMQIKIIFSHLLRNFELKLISPFPKADWSKYTPEPKGEVLVSYKRCRLPRN